MEMYRSVSQLFIFSCHSLIVLLIPALKKALIHESINQSHLTDQDLDPEARRKKKKEEEKAGEEKTRKKERMRRNPDAFYKSDITARSNGSIMTLDRRRFVEVSQVNFFTFFLKQFCVVVLISVLK